MAKENQQGLMPSVLDRLMHADSRGEGWRRGYDLDQIVNSIRRDLEELLNTHQMYAEALDNWPALTNSLLTYGLPDFSSRKMSAVDRESVGRQIEASILRFEPRLRNVRATMVGGTSPSDRTVRFHLDAQINVDPAPEVAFETIVELTSGRASVQTRETTT